MNQTLLELTNLGPVPIEDIRVDIEAKNVYSQGIVGAFAVTPTVPTLIGTLAGEGDTLSQTWTLIPGELGITNPEGEIYNLRAQIVYTYNGVVFTTTTQPVSVTVLPQPRLRLSFSHSQPDSSGNFYLEVGVENQGYGLARNLKLDLSGVTVLSNLDNRLVEATEFDSLGRAISQTFRGEYVDIVYHEDGQRTVRGTRLTGSSPGYLFPKGRCSPNHSPWSEVKMTLPVPALPYG